MEGLGKGGILKYIVQAFLTANVTFMGTAVFQNKTMRIQSVGCARNFLQKLPKGGYLLTNFRTQITIFYQMYSIFIFEYPKQ